MARSAGTTSPIRTLDEALASIGDRVMNRSLTTQSQVFDELVEVLDEVLENRHNGGVGPLRRRVREYILLQYSEEQRRAVKTTARDYVMKTD